MSRIDEALLELTLVHESIQDVSILLMGEGNRPTTPGAASLSYLAGRLEHGIMVLSDEISKGGVPMKKD